MILDEIKTALEQISPRIYYGMADDRDNEKDWNYIVFFRVSDQLTGGNTASKTIYRVAVVREDYIEEGMTEQVIKAMSTIPGMRPVNSDNYPYDYTRKSGTNTVVEVLMIDFARPNKR